MILTVFTATYNRSHLLPRLYESIKSQDLIGVEWLIVDDGSTDNTEELVKKFIEQGLVDIKYIRKDNGGKHTAFNVGLQNARGEWFFSVDSDDALSVDSISKCKSLISEANAETMGIVSLKSSFEGDILGDKYPYNKFVSTFHDLEASGLHGERSIILRTNVKTIVLFPIVQGEKFIGESVLYDKIADKQLIVSNDILTICEYQNDGLSSNPYRIMVDNPGGYKLFFRNRIDSKCNFKTRFGYIIRYLAFKKLYRGKDVPNYHGKYELFCYLLSPLASLLANQYKKKIG